MTETISHAAETQQPRRRWVLLLLIGVAAVIWGLDQLTKNWVVTSLVEGQTVPVLGEFLQWHFVRNPGAAFSFAGGYTWVFTGIAVAVVGVIIWISRRLNSGLWAAFLGMLLGGTLGNLTDRLTREPGFPSGHVIDFIYTPWMMQAIYNIADIAIVSSMVIFVLVTLFGVQIEGGRITRAQQAEKDAQERAAKAAQAEGQISSPAPTTPSEGPVTGESPKPQQQEG